MTRRRFPFWIVLVAVLLVALAAGSGVFGSSPATPSERAFSLESGIKCPSCEDLSVANSSAQTAVIVRAAIRQLIAEGKSDQQINSYLTARYGAAIVLEPPTRGWSLLVWVLPLVGGIVAVSFLALLFVRRRRAAFVEPADAARSERELDAGASADQLTDRRRFLEQSLADAFAEHRAGDLSDEDYQALRRRDTARLAALDLRMDEQDSVTPMAVGSEAAEACEPNDETVAPVGATTRVRRSRRQQLLLGGGIGAFGLALVVGVSLVATSRLPGQTPSGTANLSRQAQIQQSLVQGAALENEGKPGRAAQVYQSVLAEQPNNGVALAQLGWLEYEAGVKGGSAILVTHGRTDLVRAVKLAPMDYAGRLYLGTVILQQDKDAPKAVVQYQAFLEANPPVSLLNQAAPLLRQAYSEAGVRLPAAVPTH